MKFKKEPAILAVIILMLVLYLVMRSKDRTNYTMPAISKITVSEIDRIEISRPSGAVSLKKSDGKWVVSPEEYPADINSIQAMLEIIEKPVFVTMVSESRNYQRYGLEKGKKISVNALSKGVSVREFEIGDTTDDRHQTYIKLSDDYSVYHSPENIRTLFDKKVDELRSKGVLSFDKKYITGITITKGSEIIQLSLRQVPIEKGHGPDSVTAGKQETRWQDAGGKNIDKSSIEKLLSILSQLSCKEYLYDVTKEGLTEPVCTVRLTGKKEYTVSIFSKKDKDSLLYPAASSENGYPFMLTSKDAENIIYSLF
jgi:hypothetical protein